MLVLPDVLNAEELCYVRDELKNAPFADGKLSAHGLAKEVKNNEQFARGENDSTRDLDAVLVSAVMRHPLLNAWAVPRTVGPPLINRHGPGMSYGFHVDAPVTLQPHVMRRDLSLTLFLDDVESYEGGELEIESPGGLKQVKLPAGSAFIYATHALHQVREVTKGVRHAAVFWIQSLIQEDALRQNLFDLHAAISGLEARGVTGHELLLLNKVHQNITRRNAIP